MIWDREEMTEAYRGSYKKKGLRGKQYAMNLYVYPSHIEGDAFEYYEGELRNDTSFFDIPYDSIKSMQVEKINNVPSIVIEYKTKSVVGNTTITIVLLGMEEPEKWLEIVAAEKEKFIEKENRKKELEIEAREKQRQEIIQREEAAELFYQECYAFYVKEATPVYELFADKNRIAMLYIDENRGLNFLKIDGYAKEENRGVITYKNIHYYEKAGNIHYATDIHGRYSSFGGSVVGGNFSKLATIGGGALFGLMGMAVGAALTYKPAEQKPSETNFTIDSDIKKVDDRNVILNFYSDSKEQYIDIELPYDIYNFLITHLPEKKYSIVDELEKRTAIHQSERVIENGDLLKNPNSQKLSEIEMKSESSEILFAQKIKKLKAMKEAGLLSEEEFDNKRKELLDMI